MSEITSETAFDDITRDPNFLLIAVGGIAWIIGLYGVILIGPLLVTGGFVLTCFATAATALQRPTKGAWSGVILGTIIYLAGSATAWLPLIGLISPILIVVGAIMILFFSIPLALQYGNKPLMNEMQKAWDSRDKKKSKSKPEENEEEPES